MAKHFSFFQVVSLFRNRTFWMWMLVLAGCMSTGMAEAQVLFDVEVEMYRKTESEHGILQRLPVTDAVAYLFLNSREAEKCVKIINRCRRYDYLDYDENMDNDTIKKFTSRAVDKVDIDTCDNKFKIECVFSGMCIVVIPAYKTNLDAHLFRIKRGQTLYTYECRERDEIVIF